MARSLNLPSGCICCCSDSYETLCRCVGPSNPPASSMPLARSACNSCNNWGRNPMSNRRFTFSTISTGPVETAARRKFPHQNGPDSGSASLTNFAENVVAHNQGPRARDHADSEKQSGEAGYELTKRPKAVVRASVNVVMRSIAQMLVSRPRRNVVGRWPAGTLDGATNREESRVGARGRAFIICAGTGAPLSTCIHRRVARRPEDRRDRCDPPRW